MNQRPATMNERNMALATSLSRRRVDDLLKRARAIETDARHDERVKDQRCRACYYSTRIGGAAMTTRPCMSCLVDQQYGSTATDVLCQPCARDGGLCKECGGDLEMRTNRPSWPTPKMQQEDAR